MNSTILFTPKLTKIELFFENHFKRTDIYFNLLTIAVIKFHVIPLQ